MAVVKAAKGGKSLGNAIDYAGKENMISGKDCPDDPKLAREQMQTTKEVWEQTDGRQYKHYIQSFEPGEVTPEQAHEIGKKWADTNFPGHEVVIGTHADKEHIHNHFVVNSVNFENGKKIHLSKKDLEKFKNVSDEICREHGLSVIDRSKIPEKGQIRTYDMNKYQVLAKGNSHVLKTAIAVDSALEKSSSKADFIEAMKNQGYKVEWQENKKHITFINKDGNKVRATNLEKTFNEPKFSKEGIIHELSRLKEKVHAEPGRGTELGRNRTESNREQSGDKRIGRDGERGIEASQDYLTDQSLGNIERKLYKSKARPGVEPQRDTGHNRAVDRQDREIGGKQPGFGREDSGRGR